MVISFVYDWSVFCSVVFLLSEQGMDRIPARIPGFRRIPTEFLDSGGFRLESVEEWKVLGICRGMFDVHILISLPLK